MLRKRKLQAGLCMLILGVLFVLPYHLVADRSKKALKLLQKKEFEKAAGLLQKDLAKDSLNTATHYIFSLLYTQPAYQAYEVSVAHGHILNAIRFFKKEDEKAVRKLAKQEITTSSLQKQKERIDSLAYTETRAVNTIAAWEEYMVQYIASNYLENAEQLRDSIGFADAVAEGTWRAYENFFTKYPNAAEVSVAKARYEQLVFEDKTKGRSLQDYLQFLEEFPETPYRRPAEKAILETMTVDHRLESYVAFLQKFPSSHWTPFVQKLAFHVDQDFHEGKNFASIFAKSVTKDSLQRVINIRKAPIVPVLKDGKYGFMDYGGKLTIKPKFTHVPGDYLCGKIADDFLWGRLENTTLLMNLAGEKIWEGRFDRVENLHGGLIALWNGSMATVIHKSGVVLFKGVIDKLSLLGESLVMAAKGGKKGLYSVHGKALLEISYDEIELLRDYLLITRNGKIAVSKLSEIYQVADGRFPKLVFQYEEAEIVKDKYLHVFTADSEAILAPDLSSIIPLQPQRITPAAFGWVVQDAFGYSLLESDEPDQSLVTIRYDRVFTNETWVALKQHNYWSLTLRNDLSMATHNLDSVFLIGKNIAYMEYGGIRKIVFPSAQEVVLKPNSSVRVIGASQLRPNEREYYVLKEKERCTVLDDRGNAIFSEQLDDIGYFMPGYFETNFRGKKGIIDSLGRFALETRYQAIGPVSDKLAMVLSDGKFILVNLPERKLIGSSYDERISRYNKNYLIATKNGSKAILSAANARNITPFVYEEVEFWTDSSALVKKEGVWRILAIEETALGDTEILDFSYLTKNERNTTILFRGADGYGVMDNQLGIILPPKYNDIINIGSEENPLYFTEQHLSKAEFYVVTYADASGKLVRSEAFRPEEYLKIVCDE